MLELAAISIDTDVTDVSDTVDLNVGLCESGAGSGCGDSQSDEFLLHQKISLVVSFWLVAKRSFRYQPSFTSQNEKLRRIVQVAGKGGKA